MGRKGKPDLVPHGNAVGVAKAVRGFRDRPTQRETFKKQWLAFAHKACAVCGAPATVRGLRAYCNEHRGAAVTEMKKWAVRHDRRWAAARAATQDRFLKEDCTIARKRQK